MALFRLYIQKQCRIISSRHILHPNLNYKKNHLLWRIITSCLLLFGNGNVPSVTDTVTWFCIGFGKNINGQKTYPVAPLPIPISLFLIIHHFLFFLQFIPSCLLYRYCCRVHRTRHYHPSFDSPSDRRVCFFPSSISAPVCYGW